MGFGADYLGPNTPYSIDKPYNLGKFSRPLYVLVCSSVEGT